MAEERKARPQKTVRATVVSKAEVEDGWKIELEIPEFRSKFSTFCTRVKPELIALLKPGQEASLVLEQQRLKQGKDGTYLSDYFWGLVGIAPPGGDESGPEEGVILVRGFGKEEGRLAEPPGTRTSIEAQTALKEAVSLIVAGKAPLGELEALAARCYKTLGDLARGTTAEKTPTKGNASTTPPEEAEEIFNDAGVEPKRAPLQRPATLAAPDPAKMPTKEDIQTYYQCWKRANALYGVQPVDCWKALGYPSQYAIESAGVTPWQCWERLVVERQKRGDSR